MKPPHELLNELLPNNKSFNLMIDLHFKEVRFTMNSNTTSFWQQDYCFSLVKHMLAAIGYQIGPWDELGNVYHLKELPRE